MENNVEIWESFEEGNEESKPKLTPEEKKLKTQKSKSTAQRNGSPTYWNYETDSVEVTPSAKHIK